MYLVIPSLIDRCTINQDLREGVEVVRWMGGAIGPIHGCGFSLTAAPTQDNLAPQSPDVDGLTIYYMVSGRPYILHTPMKDSNLPG